MYTSKLQHGYGCRNRICGTPPQQRGFTSVYAISVDSTPLVERIRAFKLK